MKTLPGEHEELTKKKGTIWPGEQEENNNHLLNTLNPQLPLAHSTKEVGNKKTKEQDDQGHKMTRGNKKKKNILFGKPEEKNKQKRNKMTARRKAHALHHPVSSASF